MSDFLAFSAQLRAAFCRETSELPEHWTPENPSVGQCHVSALLLQRRFGGTVMEGRVHPPGSYLPGVTHYWIVIGGLKIDITWDQFPENYELSDIRKADMPNLTTRSKADLLAEKAGMREMAWHLVGEHGPELVH